MQLCTVVVLPVYLYMVCRVILCERTLAPSSPTIRQKEIERVGVIDWLIEINFCSVELVETNLHRRNPAQRLHAIR